MPGNHGHGEWHDATAWQEECCYPKIVDQSISSLGDHESVFCLDWDGDPIIHRDGSKESDELGNPRRGKRCGQTRPVNVWLVAWKVEALQLQVRTSYTVVGNEFIPLNSHDGTGILLAEVYLK